MTTMIYPKYGSPFDARDLVGHIEKSGRTYIIQGQQTEAICNHSKPSSLDFWMRENGDSGKKNTKQADNDVIRQLIETGLFRKGKFRCTDLGTTVKGIELLLRSSSSACSLRLACSRAYAHPSS